MSKQVELEIEKREDDTISAIKITERTEDYNPAEGIISKFFYKIKKECNYITKLSVEDADVFTQITITHLNEIDYDKHRDVFVKHDLACRLCGLDLSNYEYFTDEELKNLDVILKNIEPIDEASYNYNKEMQ